MANPLLNALGKQAGANIQSAANTLYSNSIDSSSYVQSAQAIGQATDQVEALNAAFIRSIQLLNSGKISVDAFNQGMQSLGLQNTVSNLSSFNNMLNMANGHMEELQKKAKQIDFSSITDSNVLSYIKDFNDLLQQTQGTVSQVNFENIGRKADDIIDELRGVKGEGIEPVRQALKELSQVAADYSADMTDFTEHTGNMIAALGAKIATSSKDISANLNKIIQDVSKTQSGLKNATDAEYEFKLTTATDGLQDAMNGIDKLIQKAVDAGKQGGDFSKIFNLDEFQQHLLNMVGTYKQAMDEVNALSKNASTFNQVDMSAQANKTIAQQASKIYTSQIAQIQGIEGLDESGKTTQILQEALQGIINSFNETLKQETDNVVRIANQALSSNLGANVVNTINLSGINTNAFTNLGAQMQKAGALSGNLDIMKQGRYMSDLSTQLNAAMPKLTASMSGTSGEIVANLFENGKLKEDNPLSTLLAGVNKFDSKELQQMAKGKGEEAKIAKETLQAQIDLKSSILNLTAAMQAQLRADGKGTEANALNGVIKDLSGDIQEEKSTFQSLSTSVGSKVDNVIKVLQTIDKGITSLPDSFRSDMLGWTGFGYLFNNNVRAMMGDGTQAYHWAGVDGMNQSSMTENAKRYALQEENNIYELNKLASTYGLNLNASEIAKDRSRKLYELSNGKIDYGALTQSYRTNAQIGMLSEDELKNISEYSTLLSTSRSDINANDINATVRTLHRDLGINGEEAIQVFDRITQASDNSGISASEYANAAQRLSNNFRILQASGEDVSDMMDTFGNILSNTNITISELDSLTQLVSDSFRLFKGSAQDVNNAVNDFAALHDITGIAMKDIQNVAQNVSEPIRYMGGDVNDVTDAILTMGAAANELNIPITDVSSIFQNASTSMRRFGASEEEAVEASIQIAGMAKASGVSIDEYKNAFSGLADTVRLSGGSMNDAMSMMGKLSTMAKDGKQPISDYVQVYSSLNSTFRQLGLGSNEIMKSMGAIHTLALRSGTSLTEYSGILTSITNSFVDLGLTSGDARSILGNLTDLGFSAHDASGIASKYGGALNTFAGDESKVIMSGILQGNGDIFGNLFSSQYTGTINGKSWGERLGSQMDTMLGFTRSMFGNSSLGDYQLLKQLQSMGFNRKQSSQLFDKIRNGEINSLSDLMKSQEFATADEATVQSGIDISAIKTDVGAIRTYLTGTSGETKSADEALKNAESDVENQEVGTITEMNAVAQTTAQKITDTIENYADTLQKFQSNNVDILVDRIQANYTDMTDYLNSGLGEWLQNHMDVAPTLKSILGVVIGIAAMMGINTIGGAIDKIAGGKLSSTLFAGAGKNSAGLSASGGALIGGISGGISGLIIGTTTGYSTSKNIGNQYISDYSNQYMQSEYTTSAVYDEYLRLKEQSTKNNITSGIAGGAAGLAAGALTGAAIGSFIPIPVVGTAAGALIGAGVGYLTGSLTGKAIGDNNMQSHLTLQQKQEQERQQNLLDNNLDKEVYTRVSAQFKDEVGVNINNMSDAITEALTQYQSDIKDMSDEEITAFGIYASQNAELVRQGQTTNAQLLQEYKEYKDKITQVLPEGKTWQDFTAALTGNDENQKKWALDVLKEAGIDVASTKIQEIAAASATVDVKGSVNIKNLPSEMQEAQQAQEDRVTDFVNGTLIKNFNVANELSHMEKFKDLGDKGSVAQRTINRIFENWDPQDRQRLQEIFGSSTYGINGQFDANYFLKTNDTNSTDYQLIRRAANQIDTYYASSANETKSAPGFYDPITKAFGYTTSALAGDVDYWGSGDVMNGSDVYTKITLSNNSQWHEAVSKAKENNPNMTDSEYLYNLGVATGNIANSTTTEKKDAFQTAIIKATKRNDMEEVIKLTEQQKQANQFYEDQIERLKQNAQVQEYLTQAEKDGVNTEKALIDVLTVLVKQGVSLKDTTGIAAAISTMATSSQVQSNAFTTAVGDLSAQEILSKYNVSINTNAIRLNEEQKKKIHDKILNGEQLTDAEAAIKNEAKTLAENDSIDWTSNWTSLVTKDKDYIYEAMNETTSTGQDALQSQFHSFMNGLETSDAFKLALKKDIGSAFHVASANGTINPSSIIGVVNEDGTVRYTVSGKNDKTNKDDSASFTQDKEWINQFIDNNLIAEYGIKEDLYSNFVRAVEEAVNSPSEPDEDDGSPKGTPDDPINTKNVDSDDNNKGYLAAGQLLLSNDAAYGSSYLNGGSSATTDWASIRKTLDSVSGGLASPYDSQGMSIAMRNRGAIAAYSSLPEANIKSNTTINYFITDRDKALAEKSAKVFEEDGSHQVTKQILNTELYG